MDHSEFLYLRGKAEQTRRASQIAQEEGEEFHPIITYTPLSAGLQAASWFSKGALHLRVRHPVDQLNPRGVDALFEAYFEKGATRSEPVSDAAWITYEGSGPQ